MIKKSMQIRISEALEASLQPTHLEVENQSHLHAGHAGDDGSGESHFHIIISSPQFDGISRVQRERLIHRALGDIMNHIHALSIKIT